MRFSLTAFMLLLPQPTIAGFISTGPIEWEIADGGNGHFYELVMPDDRSTTISDSLTWMEANLAAQASTFMGAAGHLATVTSGGENAFLESQFASLLVNFAPGAPDSAWIGLTDVVTEGTFEWVTGESLTYTNWANSEPNNLLNGDYVHYWNVPVNGGFTWNDEPNEPVNLDLGRRVGYIVEFDGPFTVVPEPSSLEMLSLGLMLLTAFFWQRRTATDA